jgi:RNA polymerase sigma factor (TIGR02999 family)
MSDSDRHPSVTTLLHRVSDGDGAALERLFDVLYDELHRLAGAQMRREREDHTLQPTALVHEAFIRLSGGAPRAEDRVHFASIAARVMRQVVVDHARRHHAAKRGSGWFRTTLGSAGAATIDLDPVELIALDEALAALNERQRQVVELRFFAGLEETEVAALLGVTERTVRRDWVKARAWLYDTLYGLDGRTSHGDAP